MGRELRLGKSATTELDYCYLMGLLSEYVDPWGRIKRLLQSGDLVRVKKGLYVLGEKYERPHSLLVLANLVYGPSCVSYASALAHYGLIPESVPAVWSVTVGRRKSFDTPVGHFEYFPQNPKIYAVGVSRVKIDERRWALVATPEKALFDLTLQRLEKGEVQEGVSADFLIEDLRIEEGMMSKFSVTRLEQLSAVSGLKLGSALAACIRRFR